VPAPCDWDTRHTPTGEDLSAAVTAILPHLASMGIAARKHAEECFSVKRWVEDHRRIFQTLL
jgi:hypothetical protein